MAHSINWGELPLHLILGAALTTGMVGSLHCIGMCGGLVVSCSQKNSHIFAYQLGRLTSYLFLGFLAGIFGHQLSAYLQGFASNTIKLLPAIVMGGLLIWWGIQIRFKAFIMTPKLSRLFGTGPVKLWSKTYSSKLGPGMKSYIIGLLSIFLPCGLLYAVVIGVLGLSHLYWGPLVLFSFWLGTLPAMSLAPGIFQKILSPLKNKYPLISSLTLVGLGIITISIRIGQTYGSQASCH